MRIWTGIAVAVVLSVGGAAVAQEVGALSNAQQVTDARERLAAAGRSVSEVARMLDETPDDNTIQSECLRERLTAMESLQRVALEAAQSLEASAADNYRSSEHYYNMVLVSTQKVSSEEALAQQCTGSLRFAGDTEVDFRQDENIPKEDTTTAPGLPDHFGLDGEGRIEASLFL